MHATNKYLPYLLLLILSVPLFFIGITDTHSWGDDFAQYIKEAQNIAVGKPFYESNYIFNKYNPAYAPPQYPAGYPLLLAPVVKIWGLSFRAMCYLNSVIASFLLFALYYYFRKHVRFITAICLAVLITYSGYMLDLKQSVLADVSCLLFVTLYLALRNAPNISRTRILLLIVTASLATMMRSQAVFIVLAEVIFFLLSLLKTYFTTKKIQLNDISKSLLLIIPGIIILNLIINKVIFPTPLNTSAFYNSFITGALNENILRTIAGYTQYLLTTISSFFHHDTHHSSIMALVYFIESSAIFLAVAGFVINISRRLSIDDVFFVMMCLLVLYYPVRDTRYFLPAMPVLFYYCYTSLKTILEAINRVQPAKLTLPITIVCLIPSIFFINDTLAKPRIGNIPGPKEITAFAYLKEHVANNEIIVFAKPRALTLFTGNKCMNIAWQVSAETNKRVFDSMQVKYMLVIAGFNDSSFNQYLHINPPVQSVNISEGYTLYSLR